MGREKNKNSSTPTIESSPTSLPTSPHSPASRSLAPSTREEKLRGIDWRDFELFLDVSQAGSLRSAAARTGHAVGTIRRRLARMEDKLGEPLVRREPNGLHLTGAGLRLLDIAREMQFSRQHIAAGRNRTGDRQQVRIAVTEGLGTYWLMPRLVEFQAAHPDIDVVLHCDMQRSDVAGGACDIAIQLERPADTIAIADRIGCLHLMPFASDRYLSAAGTPQSIDEWPNHRLVWQEADQVASHLLPLFIGTSETSDLIGIRTNSSSAHFRAILSGGGIGILPTYARAISRRVRPLDIGINLRREILCVTTAARQAIPSVKLAIGWLRASFSGDMFPWFRDEFIHPRDFEETLSSRCVIGLFEGFIDSLDRDEP